MCTPPEDGCVTRTSRPRAGRRDRAADATRPGRGPRGCRRRLVAAVPHRLRDLLVRVAERRSLADERLGGVGREQERIARRGSQPLAIELEPAHERRQRCERAGEIGPRREDRRLVLLQVAVVGERQALDGREQTGQAPDRGACLAACELGHIGVQLLRHHRRPRGGVLAEPGEAELRRRPEHELLADSGEVDEADGCRVEVVEREVAVGDRVERVAELVRGRGAAAGSSRRARRRRAGSAPRPRRPLRNGPDRARASRPTPAGGARP